MQQTPSMRMHVTVAAVAFILLALSLTLYAARGNDYTIATPPTSSFNPPITNAYLLQDQMPTSVYRYTVARISDYLQLNNIVVSSMHITSGVTPGVATYDFVLDIPPQSQALRVAVNVSNQSGSISSSVTINDQLQTPLVPGSTNTPGNSTSYSGFDALTDKGLAAIQANELGQALVQFAPSAGSFVINTNNIATYLPPQDQASSDVTYTFSVQVGGKTYSAKVTAIGLYQARLVLTDPQTHKQVYNSGLLDQGA